MSFRMIWSSPKPSESKWMYIANAKQMSKQRSPESILCQIAASIMQIHSEDLRRSPHVTPINVINKMTTCKQKICQLLLDISDSPCLLLLNCERLPGYYTRIRALQTHANTCEHESPEHKIFADLGGRQSLPLGPMEGTNKKCLVGAAAPNNQTNWFKKLQCVVSTLLSLFFCVSRQTRWSLIQKLATLLIAIKLWAAVVWGL